MEGINSGEQSPHNVVNNTLPVQNDVVDQQQRSPQDIAISNTSSYHIERRQILSTTERERIHSMTEEQRQSYLARRRSNYQRRRMDFTSSNSTSNQHHQQLHWRLAQLDRRRSMSEEARSNYLARRRSSYRRRRQESESSSIPDVSTLANSHFVAPSTRIAESSHSISENPTVQQTCHLEPIPYQTLTSNFQHGSSSTHQPPTNYSHQGTDHIENETIRNAQRCPRPRRYRNLARNFNEGQQNDIWLLPEPTICLHCQALLFHGATSQLCCKNGRTRLDPIPSPD